LLEYYTVILESYIALTEWRKLMQITREMTKEEAKQMHNEAVEERKRWMRGFWTKLSESAEGSAYIAIYASIHKNEFIKNNNKLYEAVTKNPITIDILDSLSHDQKRQMYLEFINLVKEIIPDTGLENKDEIVARSRNNPEYIKEVTRLAKDHRDYYNALKDVIKMYIEDDSLDLSDIPPETYTAALAYFSDAIKPPRNPRKVLVRNEYRKVLTVWGLKNIFGLNPTRNDDVKDSNAIIISGCDLVGEVEGDSFDAIKNIWKKHKNKCFHLFELGYEV
jgi:hypothetical protein